MPQSSPEDIRPSKFKTPELIASDVLCAYEMMKPQPRNIERVTAIGNRLLKIDLEAYQIDQKNNRFVNGVRLMF